MKWFKRFTQRVQDMRTLNKLCLAAEDEAAKMNELPPGAEHYVLAAVKMPDGTAREAFRQLGANPDEFRQAIENQYNDALRDVGIEPPPLETEQTEAEARAPKPALYKAKPDVSTLFKNMKAHTDAHPDAPLCGAIVLLGVARFEHGVTTRALKAMGISQEKLTAAAMGVLS